MFAPMRPSPIIPSSIAALPADPCVAPVAHRVTAPVVKPNCSATTSIGADIAKVCIPRTMPEAPASRRHTSGEQSSNKVTSKRRKGTQLGARGLAEFFQRIDAVPGLDLFVQFADRPVRLEI